jgi:S1-C subfamily serine protease
VDRSNRSEVTQYLIAALIVLIGLADAHARALRRSGFFGVQVVALPDRMREELGLAAGTGVLVQAIDDGGSAKAAGIQPNDVITHVGDHAVSSVGLRGQTARV